MDFWQELDLENKIIRILSEMPLSERARHMGRPFLTSYQIAIEFKHRYPRDFDCMDVAVGGSDVGQKASLSQYIAQHLSRLVKEKHPHVEGGILAYHHLEDITFDHNGDIIRPSRFPVSLFRYVE